MRFFTQELLDRFGASDDQVADAANVEWEDKCRQYDSHLKSIWKLLSAETRNLLKSVRLHDARVIGIDQSKDADASLFLLELAPEDCPETPILLTYKLAEPLDPAVDCSLYMDRPCYWLYDEVDVVSRAAPVIFSHAILLSHGAELNLKFHELKVASFVTAAASPANPSSGPSELPARKA